ncbi:MAG: undecaprenyldiphospho-muramoylpentapeptide beta-N-acetylglucosaminyltransferase [Bacteroidales bacterium]|jgi:UDP-N-acetylglucosamine--N-acetylmuramyl-(pentapeptide) pyrophosphoryl-undecaprenol N-acetylglucosamine transferase|nr:undecaprenyldiphospho-muramoylpentapeptide beta-N-acetylglucosaminyltransferase [Bacteroidales bacterium]
MNRRLRVIVSGGGTGGHIFPAISIANALKALLPECEILFVGAQGKMEMERVPAAGYQIMGLPVSGLKRSFSLENLKLPYKILKSLRIAGKIIHDFRPDIVVGVGGYASGPLLWMAGNKKTPYIIQEQNSFAGLTNRILSKRAEAICVAYPNMERFFPANKIILTGNPVRDGIRKPTEEMRKEARNHFGIDSEKRSILIIGGSLGAGTLNRCIMKWIEENRDSNVEIIWQCGKFYRKDTEIFNKNNPRDFVKSFEFIKDMDLAYAASDIVISRAGAGTISELCIAGKAVIFVPSPNVAENHQMHNAMALVSMGAAMMIPDNLAYETLMKEAIELINKPERVSQLESGIEKFAIRDSAVTIAKKIISISLDSTHVNRKRS